MNLFTRNSPYYHIIKYLLFLLKHAVYWIIMYSITILYILMNRSGSILLYKSVNKLICVYWRTCITIYWYNTTGCIILNWLLVKPTPSIYIGISELRLWNAAPTYISINNASFKIMCLLTDLYNNNNNNNNILIQHIGMDHIKKWKCPNTLSKKSARA
jgi:hypothetical protein